VSNPNCRADDGVTLIEVTVAMAVAAVTVSGVMGALLASIASVARARQATIATLLATERLEQLAGLSWGFGDDAAPLAVSDLSSDLGVTPSGSGGPGLSISPGSSLSADVPGYTDYLDATGQWIGGAGTQSSRASFVRRWRVSRLPGSTDALVLEVVVAPVTSRLSAVDPVRPDDVRLVTVKARKAGP
jgi:hypothetical protein